MLGNDSRYLDANSRPRLYRIDQYERFPGKVKDFPSPRVGETGSLAEKESLQSRLQ